MSSYTFPRYRVSKLKKTIFFHISCISRDILNKFGTSFTSINTLETSILVSENSTRCYVFRIVTHLTFSYFLVLAPLHSFTQRNEFLDLFSYFLFLCVFSILCTVMDFFGEIYTIDCFFP